MGKFLIKKYLYEISKENIKDRETLLYLYENLEENYYLSDDFSLDFYILLAKAGFISTSIFIENKFYLLPEIQFEYAILDFKNLHISKKVNNLLKKDNYIFKIDNNLKEFFINLNIYHKDNWLINRYEELIYKLKEKKNLDNFEIMQFSIYNNNELIASEIGYRIASTYTSLTGFCNKDKKYNNFGKLQMTLTARYLEKNNFLFWNLGHPYMQYKFDLGATLYSRKDFLKRWLSSTNI
ncbi:hypothetical protein [Arcobacter porcinus]|uniref:Leucyl/phenylalanyl-tRNA protein transferase n=1 Tax=Arcobacter porcinus TaxID=1935204 RepID=A0ABX2YFM5_9BACT|nr:hypothetical protein [Arcobacter porcinus]OCL84071.1 Leucyl/phenylalanyl-tRNA protein transferase [Arcobacter porcinus]OCL84593.1 Leucyl/phenylalanyl-tRNA protein transferase [Arcobacter porcinus]OCL89135.1 Leucyl/phenylalanyl-tRNA protein transferase [Arcobacter porcinus]OCL91555.1 Leucyl/phenylalanyl-tRNA protein transferase [Arcobacter porcinus]